MKTLLTIALTLFTLPLVDQCPDGNCPITILPPNPTDVEFHPSVGKVEILIEKDGQRTKGIGTFFVIDKERVMTASHVGTPQGGEKIVSITFYFHSGQVAYNPTRIKDDTTNDLALYAISNEALPVTIDANYKVRGWAHGYGHGEYKIRAGNYIQTTQGRLSGGPLRTIAKYDAEIQGGMSGGPIFNESGRLIGLVWGRELQRTMGLITPSPAIMEFIK